MDHERILGAWFHLPPAAAIEIERFGDPLDAPDNRGIHEFGGYHDEPGRHIGNQPFKRRVVIRRPDDFILQRQTLGDIDDRRNHQSLFRLLDQGQADLDWNL